MKRQSICLTWNCYYQILVLYGIQSKNAIKFNFQVFDVFDKICIMDVRFYGRDLIKAHTLKILSMIVVEEVEGTKSTAENESN